MYYWYFSLAYQKEQWGIQLNEIAWSYMPSVSVHLLHIFCYHRISQVSINTMCNVYSDRDFHAGPRKSC